MTRMRRVSRRPARVRLAVEWLEQRVVPSGDPSLTLNLAAHTVAENAGANAVMGTITRNNMDTSQPLTVDLTSSNINQATVPASVTIPAGAASATFGVNAVDDHMVNPTQTVTISGYAASPLAAGLDATFGSGGLASVPLYVNWSSNFPDVNVQADGKIVAVAASSSSSSSATWAITRALSSGAADTSFGANGTVVTSFPGATSGYANAVAFQPDGKILVAGVVSGTNPYDTWGVARYNTDGSLDTTFGTGGLYAFSFNSSNGYGGWAYGVAVQPDGKILVGGMLRGTGMGFSVGRLTSSGQLDTTFGTNGIASIDVDPSSNYNKTGQAMILQPDGKILMTGIANYNYLAVARFTATGAADTTFNGNGVKLIPYSAFGSSYTSIVGYGLTMQSDGKILAVGEAQNSSYSNSDYVTARLNTNGTLDTGFDGTGVVATDFTGGNDTAYDVAVQTDGKIIVAGQSVIPGQGYYLSVARYNTNGTLDTSFNGTGKLTTKPPDPFEAIWGIALQTDGKLVGIANGASSGGNFTQVVRYDTGLLTASDYLNVTDTDANPFAANDAYAVNENSSLTVAAPGVLANDTAANSTPLAAALVSAPSNGSLTLNADGSFVYMPAANFNGTDSFTYDDTEGSLTSNTATVTITVNQLPVAANDSYTANENSTLTVAAPGVLANDTAVNSTPLTAALVTSPSHGSLTLNANGSFVYTPAVNFYGTDSFTYYDTEGPLTSNTATVSITVTQAPVAANDSYTTNENTTLTVAAPGVLANDGAVNSTPLAAALVTGPSHGTLTLNADGSFVYTPATYFYGTDTFTYDDTEGPLTSNTATVTITVNFVYQPPVAVNDNYTTSENTALVVGGPGVTSLSMASQPGDYIGQGNTYNFTAATGTFSVSATANDNDLLFSYQGGSPYQWWYLEFMAPQGSTLVAGTYNNAGRAGFQPAGQPGLDVYGDGRGSNTLTGSFTVNQAVYDPSGKVLSFDATFVQHSEGATPALTGELKYNATPNMAGVLLNDFDPEGNPLQAVLVNGPANGQVTLNPIGSFTYTPNANFFGTDSFTYMDNDGTLNSNVATVTITVNPPPVSVLSAVINGSVATNVSASESGSTVTIATGSSVGFYPGELVTISGFAAVPQYDGRFTIQSIVNGGLGFTYNDAAVSNGANDAGGTATPSLIESPNANQRSMVKSMVITFNQPVTLDSGAFTLSLRTFTKNGVAGSTEGDVTTMINPVSYDGGVSWVLTFSGSSVVGGSISDGDYNITLDHTKVHGGGGLAADYTNNFYRLFGDISGNGTVTNAANIKFRNAFNSQISDANYIATFDYSSAGVVSNAANIQFRNRFNSIWTGL